MEHLRPGTRIAGYEVVAALGKGVMATVYEARDQGGRSVAIKVLKAGSAPDMTARERFVREAQLAARIVHPNIARVHGSGEVHAVPYIIYELVPGGSLGGALRTRGKLPWREASERALELAHALEAIHGAGLIHRDLKPDNVLLDEAGHCKLSDFGVARSVSGRSLTQTGEVVGTPNFMAPEQADGRGAVDFRADLHALGATLYALVTGEPPFRGAGMQVLYKVMKDPARPPRELEPSVPPPLEALILALLAKDPARRPPSATVVAQHLEALLDDGEGSRAKTRSSSQVVALALANEAAPRRSRGLVLALLGGATVLFVAGGALYFAKTERPPGPTEPPPPPPPTRPVSKEDPRDLEEGASRALRLGDLVKAKDLAQRAVAINPTRAQAWGIRAEACVRLRDRGAATEAVKRALELDPRLAQALAARAALHADHQRWDPALADAEAALAIEKSALARAVRCEVLFSRVKPSQLELIDFGSDDYVPIKALLAEAREAQSLDPKLGRLWVVVALAASAPTQRDQALSAAEKALELEPQNPWSHFAVARTKGLKTPGADVMSYLDKAIELDPDVATFWAERALVKRNQNERDGALADAEKALKLHEDEPIAWLVRGLLEHDTKRFGPCMEAARKLLALDPNSRFGKWLVGDCLLQTGGDLEEATRTLQNAVGLGNGFYPAILSLTHALEKKGDLNQAMLVIESFIEQAGESEFRQDAMRRREEIERVRKRR